MVKLSWLFAEGPDEDSTGCGVEDPVSVEVAEAGRSDACDEDSKVDTAALGALISAFGMTGCAFTP